METIALSTLYQHTHQLIQHARTGNIFIYPTDTIYGIGGVVTPEVIQALDTAKNRLPGKHYSIIAPSYTRIDTYFTHDKNSEDLRNDRSTQFPWRWLTILLPVWKSTSDDNPIDFSLLSPTTTIWVRYLGDHPFQEFITGLGEPFITTSCNISGAAPITKLVDIPPTLIDYVSVTVDGGILDGISSVVIDSVSGEVVRG